MRALASRSSAFVASPVAPVRRVVVAVSHSKCRAAALAATHAITALTSNGNMQAISHGCQAIMLPCVVAALFPRAQPVKTSTVVEVEAKLKTRKVQLQHSVQRQLAQRGSLH